MAMARDEAGHCCAGNERLRIVRHARGKPRPYGTGSRMGIRSSQHLMGGAGLLDAEGDLVGDADAVAFEGDDFFWMIGEDANILEAEVDQDLRADTAFVLNHALARRFAIELAALMKMDLGEHARLLGRIDAEAATGVMEIQ